MGNIRPSFIKIRAIRLCEEYPDQFSPNDSHEDEMCNCTLVHDCNGCGETELHNVTLCRNSEFEKFDCTKVYPCSGCGVGNIGANKPKQCSKCKGKKFEDPITKDGFNAPHRPHSTAFDHNKHLVSQYTDADNKRMRNWIAGYVTRYMQRRED